MKIVILCLLFIQPIGFCDLDESLIPLQDDPSQITINEWQRIFAIGDIQGDLTSFSNLLKSIGLIDETTNGWIGKKGDIVVLVGDLMDRCASDRGTLDFVMRLKKDAASKGSLVIPLLGNHEFLNLDMDFRYAESNANIEFNDYEKEFKRTNKVDIQTHLKSFLPIEKLNYLNKNPKEIGRALAFGPNGYYRRFLSKLSTVLKVGNIVFAHAGFSPKYMDFLMKHHPDVYKNPLDKINISSRFFMVNQFKTSKESTVAREIIFGQNEPPGAYTGLFWTRFYNPLGVNIKNKCDIIKQKILPWLGASVMVLGHNTTDFLYDVCGDETVWSIDNGLCIEVKKRLKAIVPPNSEIRKNLEKNYALLITKGKNNVLNFQPISSSPKGEIIFLTPRERRRLKKQQEMYQPQTLPELIIKENSQEDLELKKLTPRERRRLKKQQEISQSEQMMLKKFDEEMELFQKKALDLE